MEDSIKTSIALDDAQVQLECAYSVIDDLREDNRLLNQIMDLFDIQSAGIPAWMCAVICRKAYVTAGNDSAKYRESVAEQIAAYHALEAYKDERRAATLARIMKNA